MASAVSTASAGKLEPAWPTFRPAKPDPVLGIKLIYRVSQRDARFSKIKNILIYFVMIMKVK